MIITPITFVDEPQEEIQELLGDYLSALYRNGQIYKDYALVKKDVAYFGFLSLPERDSLDDKYAGIYVRNYVQRINKWFTINFEYVGERFSYGEPCICENPSWYYLNTQLSRDSPVICGDCRNRRSLYRLPYITEDEEFFMLQNWQCSYISMDTIWFNDISDRFSYRQMNDPNSSLSKIGRRLCKAFEKATGKPFYYFLFYYMNSRKKNASCPICGKSWQEIKEDNYVSKRCEDCKLIFGY